MTHRTLWLLKAPLGLIFVGAGLSVAMDAATRKAAGEPWFVPGTLGLVIANAGLCVFGDSVKDLVLHRIGHDATAG